MLAHAHQRNFSYFRGRHLSKGVTAVVSRKLGEIAALLIILAPGHRQSLHII